MQTQSVVRVLSQHSEAVEQLQAVLDKLGAGDQRFARDLINTHNTRGLSPNQAVWVPRLVERAATPKAAPVATALATEVNAIKKSLDAAFGRGLKRPALRIGEFHFSRAPDTGKNPGCIYVKADGEYVGKIDGSGFRKAYACTTDDEAKLQQIAQNPLQAARDHGKLTGACSCCGRALSDPESIQNGIGPVCEKRFFS